MAKPKVESAWNEPKHGTKRIKCSCVQDFQDKTYGKGVRIANKMKDGFRCTGCGQVTRG